MSPEVHFPNILSPLARGQQTSSQHSFWAFQKVIQLCILLAIFCSWLLSRKIRKRASRGAGHVCKLAVSDVRTGGQALPLKKYQLKQGQRYRNCSLSHDNQESLHAGPGIHRQSVNFQESQRCPLPRHRHPHIHISTTHGVSQQLRSNSSHKD